LRLHNRIANAPGLEVEFGNAGIQIIRGRIILNRLPVLIDRTVGVFRSSRHRGQLFVHVRQTKVIVGLCAVSGSGIGYSQFLRRRTSRILTGDSVVLLLLLLLIPLLWSGLRRSAGGILVLGLFFGRLWWNHLDLRTGSILILRSGLSLSQTQ